MRSIGRLSTLLAWLFSLTATAPVLADGGLLETVSPTTSKDLQRQGLLFSGDYYGALFAIQNSQNGAHTVWDDGLQLNLGLDLATISSVDAIKGLQLNVQGRWREPSPLADPNTYVAGNSMFDPSNWASGTGWRFLQANLQYTSALGTDNPKTLWAKAGWVQPRYEFILQSGSDLVLNNAVNSAKGLGGNIPFSSSFSTWGAMVRWMPDSTMYLKGGLFMAYPDATSSSNNGLWFGGNPTLGDQTGLMSMVELGWLPQLGQARLQGRYALGGYSYDNRTSASSRRSNANYGLQTGMYLQLDQQLWRGLSTFNLLSLAPQTNNQFPLYGHTGLSYRGLFSNRPNDTLVATLAYGAYSPENPGSIKTSTVFLEAGYHLALSSWLDLYPFLQWSIRPAGTSTTADAFVIGFGTKVTF
jgi:carbohydrate-selective porin OprB